MATGRGKPARRQAKQERSRATVDAVLEAATRVLLHEGYVAATTNRIAEVAGVSIGTLYQYFANREQVFDGVIRRELEAFVGALTAPPLDPEEGLERSLRRFLHVGVIAQRHGPELIRALDQVPGALFRRRLHAVEARVTALVRSLLEAHRDELQVEDLDLAAFVITSAVEGVGYRARPSQFGEPLVDELTALFTRYLVGGSRRGRRRSRT